VDGHRYADGESGWYSGQRHYDTRSSERPSGAFRLPEESPVSGPPPSNPYPYPDATTTGGHTLPPVAATGGHTLPPPTTTGGHTLPPPTTTGGHTLPPPTATGSSPLAPEPDTSARMYRALPRSESRSRGEEAVYQSRRPVTALLVTVVMFVLMIPVVRLLLAATFARDPSPGGIVPAVLLTLGFTLAGIGLFAVARGGPVTRDGWLRPPVAYLPVGLIVLLAAGLAVA
jgi:hypothetical protein